MVEFQVKFGAHITATSGVENNKAPSKPPKPNFSNLAIPMGTAVELDQEIAEA